MLLNSSDWKYCPTKDRTGDSKFDGLPCPTVRTLETIGEDGVKEIDAIVKEVREFKKKIFDVSSKFMGFPMGLNFYNEKIEVLVRLKDEIYYDSDPDDVSDIYAFPDRAVEGNYTVILSKEYSEWGDRIFSDK